MPDSPLEPLTLPRDLDGWHAFAAERPRERLDRVAEIDARLVAETSSGARERLALWNEAELALVEAAAPSHLLSESHPDAEVRDAAEAQAQAVEAVQSRRLLDRELWGVFADLDARPGQYERLEALTRRWATELRTPQLQSSPSDIYVFCQYGMNRSGLAAGLLMRELGVEASEVLRRIRRARPGSLSNHSFVRLIEEWQPG